MDKTTTSLIIALVASLTVIGGMAIFDDDTPVFKCEDRGLIMPCESFSIYYGLPNGKCYNEDLGNNYTYIALQRTTNFIVTEPVIDLISISGGSTYFILQKDMMKLNAINTAPETCDATMLGAIYFDTSEDDMCVCKSGGWKVMTDGSECT